MGEGEKRISVGDGVGTSGICEVELNATTAAGRKYANPPATAERAIASAARVMMVKGLRRPRDARARCPGFIPSGTGENCNPGCGLAL